MERADTCTSANSYEILSTKALTRFSNNIRSNFGYMSRATDVDAYGWDKLFHQAGRKVFEEVSPMAAAHINDHLASLDIKPAYKYIFIIIILVLLLSQYEPRLA